MVVSRITRNLLSLVQANLLEWVFGSNWRRWCWWVRQIKPVQLTFGGTYLLTHLLTYLEIMILCFLKITWRYVKFLFCWLCAWRTILSLKHHQSHLWNYPFWWNVVIRVTCVIKCYTFYWINIANSSAESIRLDSDSNWCSRAEPVMDVKRHYRDISEFRSVTAT